MTDEAFSEEDSEYPRSDRFKARRKMINTMIQMGVAPTHVRFETPKGVHKHDKLKAMVDNLSKPEGQKFVQVGQQFDRPPGTGKISGLVELARKERLSEPNQDESQRFKAIGKEKTDCQIREQRLTTTTKDKK